jgi:hypothetical protein
MSVRRLRIDGEFLNSFLRSNEVWSSRLPADVNVIEVLEEDRKHHAFIFLVESKEFPIIPEGKLVPYVEARFTRRKPTTVTI